MKSAKEKRPSEQRFSITFGSFPLRYSLAKIYFTLRQVDYHLGARLKTDIFQDAKLSHLPLRKM
jgi:hypothetical protein